MEWLYKLLSESDNATPCPVRWGGAITAFIYHAGAVFMLAFQGFHLDMAALGQYVQHMATLIGVVAGGAGVKSILKADAQ